ncbi:PREDICTED: protein ASPARTIC PROTEASE IN GUARD CELL 1-like [Nicotiana attenuata]|nr:PREDICTED: protein ASPARTIC PROTEASE IN GUARD CELL 1-like [Nicotiana attenuata]
MSLDPSKISDPPMPSYTFTLYNRDVLEKSKFKDYDSLLTSRLARCHARASYLSSFFEDDNNIKEGANLTWQDDAQGGKIREKVPKTTGTYYANGEYVASFLLGSDEVRSFLLIDSGSDLVWWQCGPCEANKCYKQNQPLYDSTTSKTFRKVDCIRRGSSCMIEDPTLRCDQNSRECRYNFTYTDGSRTKGFLADDVITFVLDQRPVRVTFGCGKDQIGERNFTGTYSGIAGLGRRVNSLKVGGYSLPSQFGASLFSMCLPSFYSRKGSTISFHKTPWPRATSAKLLPNYRYPTLHFVNLYKVFINDKAVPVKPSWWRFKRDMSGGVVLDTGTTFTRFPNDFYVIFRYCIG